MERGTSNVREPESSSVDSAVTSGPRSMRPPPRKLETCTRCGAERFGCKDGVCFPCRKAALDSFQPANFWEPRL